MDIANSALGNVADISLLERENDMLRICFEGIYFPVEETLECITKHLHTTSQGKLDIIDLEAWTLTPHYINGKNTTSNTFPLTKHQQFP